jgi:hypothetical protein
VVDDGGNPMVPERVDGTFPAGANISIGKARTAAVFPKPTRVFEEIIARGRTAMLALNDFTPLQGGVPITVDGQIVARWESAAQPALSRMKIWPVEEHGALVKLGTHLGTVENR